MASRTDSRTFRMGVAGLWEVLRPAGQIRSLTELAVEDGFNANSSRQRGFRIGIDASIWFFHAASGREGENPELRTLFFRCCRLLQSPLLPLFVFDGPNRPAIKRGKRVGGNAHWLTQGMKNIIDAFGFEWWVAPGEAEAELAYLNRVGIIDAVLSDDVDNFLFGATMVIRNPSSTLSGNRAHPVKNAQGKDDGNHVLTYTADTILSDPSVSLSRAGTILIGLLSGGDYIPAGLPGCGQKFASGLARAGFGDSLLKAVKELKGARLDAFLDQWRRDIKNELKTNSSGLLPSKKPSLAGSLPDDFPSLPVLMSYADPITSENTPQKGKHKAPIEVWRNDPDPMRIASLCELYFEWGVKSVIVQRFRTVLWPGIVCRAVRRVVMNEDARQCLTLDSARRPDNEEEEDYSVGPLSPTKRISHKLSTLALSSPSKKSSTTNTSSSGLPGSESFVLSSLVPLTSPASSRSSRSASPSLPTSSASGPAPLLLEVLSQRTHASTDSTLEYRVLIDPTTLVERAENGVKGLRPPLVGGLFGSDPEDEDGSMLDQDADESGNDDTIGRLETAASAASKLGTKKRKARRENPTTPLRLWLPACMIRAAAPTLTEAYEEKVKVREEKKAKRGTRGGRVRTGINSTSRSVKMKNNADGGDEPVPGPSSKTGGGSNSKTKSMKIGGGGGKRKPKQLSEAQDDAYEFIDLSAGESPCSSDEGGIEENTKDKARAKTGRTNAAKLTKASGKTDTTNEKAATNTMTKFFKTSKPSTAKTTKSKPPALRPIYQEEEEDSSDFVVPPSLAKSSRPLDLLRAKSKRGTAVLNPTSPKARLKATSIPRYEEEELSSGPSSKIPAPRPNTSNLPCQRIQPIPKARRTPLFIDVSDTDSDIGLSDVRHPLPGSTATFAASDGGEHETGVGGGETTMSADAGETLSTFIPKKSRNGGAGGVIDLTARGNVSRPKGTPSMPTITVAPVRPVSVPVGSAATSPMSIARSSSKLAHILLSSPASDGTGGESEGDELPTFHGGSPQPKMKMRDTTARPVPRPFPVQFASWSPVSPNTPSRGDAENDDTVEIVDVFTTPRGPSPPRSPTPSPSPVKPLPVYAPASAEPTMLAKSKQSSVYPTSPTESKSQIDTEPHKKTKQYRRGSSDWDTRTSGSETKGIPKSPRKSVAHSSPRHEPGARRRSSSSTPSTLSRSASHADSALSWTGDTEGCHVPNSRRSQLEHSGSTCADDSARQRPRVSDASAIYISSGSEDEGGAGMSLNNNGCSKEREAEGDENQDVDENVDEWADTGMILSAPPSPARLLAMPSKNPASAILAVQVMLPHPTPASKFKPAPAATSKARVRAPQAKVQVYESTTNDEGAVEPRPVPRVPLLVARAKRSKATDGDVIDLTSD